MTTIEVLSELESLRDEKVFARNLKLGVPEADQYGVKLGDLRKLAKKAKTDHELALELWKTGKLEARLVAMLVMKPVLLSASDLTTMVREIQYVQVAEWFNSYVLKNHPVREQLREAWMESDNVWAARSGWSLTAGRISRESEGLDLTKVLDRIEKEMPQAPPEVQWTMNFALGYTGIHHPEFRERAIAIGEKLGMYRDYPVSKGCTSPFVPIWIDEMLSRQQK